MVDKKWCDHCRYRDLLGGQDPCRNCITSEGHPKFVPLTPEQDNPTEVKKAKIISRLSSWEYTIGYAMGVLTESEIKNKVLIDSLEHMAAEIEGFVLDVLDNMG